MVKSDPDNVLMNLDLAIRSPSTEIEYSDRYFFGASKAPAIVGKTSATSAIAVIMPRDMIITLSKSGTRARTKPLQPKHISANSGEYVVA